MIRNVAAVWIEAGVLGALVACAAPGPRSERGSHGAPARWLKGQLHVHTDRSEDGKASPEAVVRWYAQHGFDFVVLTDHNVVTDAPSAGLLVIPGVELTQRLPGCQPPSTEVCQQHLNALFVENAPALSGWKPRDGPSRLAIYEDELREAGALGALAQLDHPNYGLGADAEILTRLAAAGLRLFEVANFNGLSRNEGDAIHPPTERLWDEVLSRGALLYGTATDDAHQFDGGGTMTPGHAWVMVNAEREPRAIRHALSRGAFYASTGVVLSRAGPSADGRALEVEAPGGAARPRIDVIAGGQIVATSEGPSLVYPLSPDAGWVRAVVRDREGHAAWVQPVRAPDR